LISGQYYLCMEYPLKERFRDTCVATFTPETCINCGVSPVPGRPLCVSCLNLMLDTVRSLGAARSSTRCAKCGRPLVSSSEICVSCRLLPSLSAVDSILPLFPYSATAHELLGAWKTRGNRGLTWSFALIIRVALSLPEFANATIIPVPPRPDKIREKGWDQIEDIVGILERSFGLPVCRCLTRTSRIAQKTLGRAARQQNLKGHIEAIDGVVLPETAIVIDDLMTTGSTIDACANALNAAGCGKVYGLTLFFD